MPVRTPPQAKKAFKQDFFCGESSLFALVQTLGFISLLLLLHPLQDLVGINLPNFSCLDKEARLFFGGKIQIAYFIHFPQQLGRRPNMGSAGGRPSTGAGGNGINNNTQPPPPPPADLVNPWQAALNR